MNRLLIAAGALGFLVVGLGAFGAHGLEGRLSADGTAWWETATLYGLVHAVAALALSLAPGRLFAWAGWAFIFGAVLFSGSLYVMALGGPHVLGVVTPLGGLCFLAGWAIAAYAGATR